MPGDEAQRRQAATSWRDPVQPGSVLLFFLLTFAVSWTGFLLSAKSLASTSGPGRERNAFYLVGVFGPAIAALALTRMYGGTAAVSRLLRRLSPDGVSLRWYAFAVLYMPVIKLGVALLHRVVLGAWPRVDLHEWYVIPIAIVVSTPFQAGEEIGWRGYALPRLSARLGLPGASLVLGLVWAAWHLPFFFMPGVDKTGQSFPLYALQVMALSVVLAWLYWRTGGNLLLAMIMHSASNQTVGVVPSGVAGASNPFGWSHSPVAWLTVGLLWATSVRLLWEMRTER